MGNGDSRVSPIAGYTVSMVTDQPDLPDALIRQRRERWGQTRETRIPDPEAATAFIERVGIATLFPASPEIPDLFRAYVGDPDAAVDSKWDSPSGHVYTWRWALGHRNAAFYASLIRGRPTYIRWSLLPTILRLFGSIDQDAADLYAAGQISDDARRIAEALAAAEGDPPATLSTGELRRRAGFPSGKAQRAAYLKAVGELEARLLTAKVFSGQTGDDEMYQTLVSVRHADAAAQARTLAREAAIDALLSAYLPHAVYLPPKSFAQRFLGEAEVTAGLERMAGVQKFINRGIIIYTRKAD
jgi:hypothetical protein